MAKFIIGVWVGLFSAGASHPGTLSGWTVTKHGEAVIALTGLYI